MKIHFFALILLLIVLIFLHVLFYTNYLNYGMHSDDWISLVRYKALDENFLNKILILWERHGPHVTSQIIYIGLLESLFGLNYKTFALTNSFFKILATLSLYPLIVLVFKRKLLAFLTAILYSISYSTVGTLFLVVKGTEYQAILFMNIFLIIYYLVTKKQTISVGWILALIFSFLIAILLAPPRLFPLVLLPLFIELFLWLYMRTSYNFKNSAKKLFSLYLPLVLVFIYHPVAITGTFIIPIIHLQKILEGYWFILLTPFSGLGYMIFWDNSWVKLLGSINTVDFESFLVSILSNNLFFFGAVTIFLAVTLSKNKIRFILLTLILNSILGILTFFLATHHLKLPEENRINYDFNALQSALVGIYVVVLSIVLFFDWLTTKKDRLILILSLGPLVSVYFIFCNWLFAGSFLGFGTSHEYLTIPAIGISLMFAAILTIYFDRIKTIKFLNMGVALALFALFLFFIPIYSINKKLSVEYISGIVKKNNASWQQDLHQRIRGQIKNPDKDGNKLVYFDWTKDKINQEFYSEAIYSTFPIWMHYYKGKILEGCIDRIFDTKGLSNSFTQRGGKVGFLLPGICVETKNGTLFTNYEVFYQLDDFYALEINNNKLTDIKDNILKDIGATYNK